MTTELPILYNSFSMRAFLADRKRETRRAITPQPWLANNLWHYSPNKKAVGLTGEALLDGPYEYNVWPNDQAYSLAMVRYCPYGQRGGRVWGRESWILLEIDAPTYRIQYTADKTQAVIHCDRELDVLTTTGPKPGIFMPREFSRITHELVNVRAERLHEITREGALAEGIEPIPQLQGEAIQAYGALWDAINFSRGYGWKDNPWVWVLQLGEWIV
jgi:hypothetical protein